MSKIHLYLLGGFMLLAFSFCATTQKSSQKELEKQLLEHTHKIIFGRYRSPKPDPKGKKSFIYPILAYQPTIQPVYKNEATFGLSPTYKNKPALLRIPDSLQQVYHYFPYTSLDSVLVLNEEVSIYSPLMPTTQKDEYVIQLVFFMPEDRPYSEARMTGMFFDYYSVKNGAYTFLRREEYLIGFYEIRMLPYLRLSKW